MMIQDKNGVERFSIPPVIHKLLLRVKEKITKDDQEVWFAFGGDTGCGKSVMAQQWMYVLFPELTLKQVCFTKEEFIRAVLDSKKGSGIICDEAISIFFSRGAMTKEGRLIAEIVNQIRQKNLAIFICIPEVLNLDWIIQKKLNAYIHVWENRGKVGEKVVTIKGNGALFPEIPGHPFKSRLLEYMRKKRGNTLFKKKRPEPYCVIKGSPIGDSYKKPWYPVGEKGYRKKKESVLDKYQVSSEPINKDKEIRNKVIYKLRESGKTWLELVDLFGIPRSTIRDAYNTHKRVMLEK